MPTPGTIAIIILVILILAVIVSCIQIVQQSKAYVIERLGAGTKHFRDTTTPPHRRHDGPERVVIPGTDADQDPHTGNGGKCRGGGSSVTRRESRLTALKRPLPRRAPGFGA